MNTQTILSDEELAPLLERKRQMQAHLASQRKSSCSTGACGGGGQSSCSTRSAPSSPATVQPNVLKAILIAISVLAVSALAWWGVTG